MQFSGTIMCTKFESPSTRLAPQQKRAFTLIELLVVISIIGVLIGMLLPAVQAVRESARRAHCLNNLKQLGLAVQNYHDTQNQIPPSRAADGFLTWPVYLMPFTEDQNLYERFDMKAMYVDQDVDIVKVNMPTMMCTSRRTGQEDSEFESKPASPIGAVGDYAGNAGTSRYFPHDDWAYFDVPVDGIFNSGYESENPVVSNRLESRAKGRYKLADVTDGTSNTIFIGEKAVNIDFMGNPGGWGDGSIYNGDDPGTAMRIGGYGMQLAATTRFGAPGPGAIPVFGSSHPAVVNFLFGDGSVRNLTKSTDEETLRRLFSRNDGMVVSVD